MMVLWHMIDTIELLKLTQGQGHKVKGQGQICCYVKYWDLGYKLWTDEWILMILSHMVDINKTLKLTQGQGHKVKGQGQISNYVKKFFWLLIMIGWSEHHGT